MKRKLKIGECFEVPLENGQFAYGQYVYLDKRGPFGLGTLVRIFDFISDHPLGMDELESKVAFAKLMFQPVFVGLSPAIQSGRWRIIGNLPLQNFVFPKFRSTFGTKPGTYHDWRIWDGKERIFIGELPAEYRSLELEIVWGAEGLEQRIIEGKYRGDQMF